MGASSKLLAPLFFGAPISSCEERKRGLRRKSRVMEHSIFSMGAFHHAEKYVTLYNEDLYPQPESAGWTEKGQTDG